MVCIRQKNALTPPSPCCPTPSRNWLKQAKKKMH
nr:MAG TPA: hypothetical protein [Caudoviricetes sp.]